MRDFDFSKILIGDDRMILCREKDLKGVNIPELIEKAFPEHFAGQSRLGKLFKRTKFMVETCYEMYSSRFDGQIEQLEKSHDWDREPFVALNVFEKDGKIFCGAEPVIV